MDGEPPVTFGETFRALRLKRQMSIEQLAADMRAWRGRRKGPATETLIAYERRDTPLWPHIAAQLAAYFELPADYFFREKTPEEIEAIRTINRKRLREIRKGW